MMVLLYSFVAAAWVGAIGLALIALAIVGFVALLWTERL